jgi:DNA replication protein
MREFTGFPAGHMRFTSVPDLFFSKLLPAIDSLAELKVTLHLFWVLYHKRGYPRAVSRRELLGDPTLRRALAFMGGSPEEALDEGLKQAVTRGTLLHVVARQGEEEDDFYLLNTDEGRRAMERLCRGELPLEVVEIPDEGELPIERPNIFVLYEQSIGLLSPLIADELREAEERYPPDWIEEAFKRALENNVRKWSYVRAILERWATEGKGSGEGKDSSRQAKRWYTDEEYRKYIKH